MEVPGDANDVLHVVAVQAAAAGHHDPVLVAHDQLIGPQRRRGIVVLAEELEEVAGHRERPSGPAGAMRDREHGFARRDRELEGVLDAERSAQLVQVVAHVAALPAHQHPQPREQRPAGERARGAQRIPKLLRPRRCGRAAPGPRDRGARMRRQRAVLQVVDQPLGVALEAAAKVDEVDRRDRAEHREARLIDQDATGRVGALVGIIEREDPVGYHEATPQQAREVPVVEARGETLRHSGR